MHILFAVVLDVLLRRYPAAGLEIAGTHTYLFFEICTLFEDSCASIAGIDASFLDTSGIVDSTALLSHMHFFFDLFASRCFSCRSTFFACLHSSSNVGFILGVSSEK